MSALVTLQRLHEVLDFALNGNLLEPELAIDQPHVLIIHFTPRVDNGVTVGLISLNELHQADVD